MKTIASLFAVLTFFFWVFALYIAFSNGAEDMNIMAAGIGLTLNVWFLAWIDDTDKSH